jgi:hypothetical protein
VCYIDTLKEGKLPIFTIDIDECKCHNRQLNFNRPVHQHNYNADVWCYNCFTCNAWVLMGYTIKRGFTANVILR